MAYSDHLASIEPWTFRTTFADSWFTEALARDAQALTNALHKSLSHTNPDTTPTSAVSALSGSDQETPSKRQRTTVPPATGKVSKRKSRASKRSSQTTFIAADPANFRQMVQQVTGVRVDNSQMIMAPMLKPEPQRNGSRLLPSAAGDGVYLPTLDTSAVLLDRHRQEVGSAGPGISGPGPLAFGIVDDGDCFATPALDFDTFPSFPTLESWKVMFI
ncbi:calmodulin-binding protein 25 [Senna tora]|uniref:Calmodulin-binding protein 25 n=1 Tax=Senna tora TaxID=362788 RepID=A0A834SIA2_9FABA|nr:calmodulin-binding protein 25 [Senna tora]